MKLGFTIIALTMFGFGLCAQQGNEISKSLDVIVFPSSDQGSEQQELDEFRCYKWAKSNSDYDPMQPEEAVDASKLGADGSTIKGAAGGALLGAIIGGIAGDTKKGLAIGAGVGAVGGASGKAKRDAEIRRKIAEQERLNKESLLKFKKAFCTCMEAKDYKATY